MVTHVRIGDVDNRCALHRLAGKARQDGIRLYRDRSGRYFASSASKPGTLHYVTAVSCDCTGFFHHGRCKHNSALLMALGWLDGTPDPEPVLPNGKSDEPASCPVCGECGGLGEVQDLEVRQHGRFTMLWARCTSCHGTGLRTAVAA